MVDLKQIFTTTSIVGLFVFGIMFFIISVQADNGVSTPITNDSRINTVYGNLSSQLSIAKSNEQKVFNTFGNTTPTQSYGELEVGSIFPQTNTVKSTATYLSLIISFIGWFLSPSVLLHFGDR